MPFIRTVLSLIVASGLVLTCITTISFAAGKMLEKTSGCKFTTRVGVKRINIPRNTCEAIVQKSTKADQALPEGKRRIAKDVLLAGMLRTAKAYFDKGNVEAVKYIGIHSDEYPTARKKFIVPMLDALKLLVENGIPKDDSRPVVPGVSKFDIPAGSPGREEALKKQEEQIEARNIALLMNELIGLREIFTRNIAGYYLKKPYATDELRQLAADTIKNDDVVNELIKEVETNIAPPLSSRNTDPF